MKLTILLFLFSIPALCQDSDTIEIAGDKTTQILFPADILDKDTGNKAFEILSPTGNYINPRILKLYYAGTKIDYSFESNLQVETVDGYIYDFVITNVKNPKKTTYSIKETQAITNIKGSYKPLMGKEAISSKKVYNLFSNESKKPKDSIGTKNPDDNLYYNDKEIFLRNICQELAYTKSQYSRFKSVAISQNIELSIKGIYSNRNELYFVFNLKNHGTQSFDIKKWSVYKSSTELANTLRTGVPSGKEVIQPLPYEPEYIHNLTKRIAPKSEASFTLVLSKFTIAKNKAVYFDIDELNGERDIYLPIFYKKINYPINYKK